MKNNRGRRRHFTLVEILMVTGMICLIVALIAVAYNGVYRSWATRNTIAAMKATHLTLDRFNLANGYFPQTEITSPEHALGWQIKATGDSDYDPAINALARDLLQTVTPYAFAFTNQWVCVFDDFGPKPPSATAGQIHPIYYVYPYLNTGTLALFSKGKDNAAGTSSDTDDIIYLPRGLNSGAYNLKPGFYMVRVDKDGNINCDPEDIEPLAE